MWKRPPYIKRYRRRNIPRMLKGLEIQKNNLEIKLKVILHDIEQKKDAGINFKDLGLTIYL